jgi:hypothetical protein
MASKLYKVTGRSVVEVPAQPISNTRPSTAGSGEGQSKNPSFPSPYNPPGNFDSFGSKPYKPPATTTSGPRPGNNPPVSGDNDWVLVYIPPNPLIAGSIGEYVRLPRDIAEGYFGGVSIPFP